MRLAIIPARSGSRRIKDKNVRDFFGQPIMAYSIDAARKSGLFDHVIVSTDSGRYAEIAVRHGAKVLMRSQDTAQDHIGTQLVMQAVLQQYGEPVDHACCIYATCPMLEPADLIRGYATLIVRDADYAMAVNAEPLFDAGMLYWGTAEAFIEGRPLIDINTQMVPIPSNRVCDINTEDDWRRAEQMYARWKTAALKAA